MDKLLDRNHWKKMLPFIRAFTEGKEIEIRICRKWAPLSFPTFDDSNTEEYRIKPEPKYVPFTYETALANSLQKKAIRYKGSTEVVTILAFNTEYVFILDFTRPYKYLLEHYEFLDGSPCGILED